MIYLIWGILNVLLILGWIWIGFNLLFRRKIHPSKTLKLYSFVFFLGLIIMLNGNSKNTQDKTEKYTKPATVSIVKVGETLTHHVSLILIQDKNSGQILPQHSHSYLTGFVAGLVWNMLTLNEIDGNLQITGTLEWKILGINLYDQQKYYSVKLQEKQRTLF